MLRTLLCAILVIGERLLQESLDLARRLADERAEARILWLLLTLYTFTGRPAQAMDCGQVSLAIARKLNMREQMAHTLSDMGVHVYHNRMEFEMAISALRESMALWQELDNLPMLADSVAGLAMITVLCGEYREAIDRSEEAFGLSQSIDNLWGQSYSRMKIGLAFWEQGQIATAVTMMEQAIRLSDLSGFSVPQVYTRIDLIRLYAELGEFGHALQEAEQALTEAESLGSSFLSGALGASAYVHALKGDLAQAEGELARGRCELNRTTNPVLYVLVPLAEAIVALRKGDYGRAQTASVELLQMGARAFAPQALYLQSQALLGAGKSAEAYDTLRVGLRGG